MCGESISMKVVVLAAYVTLILPALVHPACNTAPTAQPDTVTVVTIRPVLIDPLANDSDADGDALTVTLAGTCLGSITENEDGSFWYQRIGGVVESCVLTYEVEDSLGGTAESTIAIDATVLGPEIFADGFESGNTVSWQ